MERPGDADKFRRSQESQRSQSQSAALSADGRVVTSGYEASSEDLEARAIALDIERLYHGYLGRQPDTAKAHALITHDADGRERTPGMIKKIRVNLTDDMKMRDYQQMLRMRARSGE